MSAEQGVVVPSIHDLVVTENPADPRLTPVADNVLVTFRHDGPELKMMGVFAIAPDQAELLPVGTKVRFCFEVLA